MHRLREQIHQTPPPDPEPVLPEHRHIPLKARSLTGNVHHLAHAILDDLGQRLRINALPGRIQHDIIRLLRNLGELLQDITRYKFTVLYPIERRILPRRPDCLRSSRSRCKGRRESALCRKHTSLLHRRAPRRPECSSGKKRMP